MKQKFNIVYLSIIIGVIITFSAINTSQINKLKKEFQEKYDYLLEKQQLQKNSASENFKDKNLETTTLENLIVNTSQEISKSVVSVNVLKKEKYIQKTNTLFEAFFGPQTNYRNVESAGTGLIITESGYIITNAHVVEKAIDVKIVVNDGRHFNAQIIGVAKEHDIAVLKIKGDNLSPAKIGDSDSLQTGKMVIALGNPYSFVIKDSKPTLSFGIISAVNRNFTDYKSRNPRTYKRMIQTDAAINPGNSGGPLVDIYGNVIGINAFILSESGGSVGIGFAIPINRIKKVVFELVEFGKIRDFELGFRVSGRNLYSEQMSLKVVRILPNSPCEKAGLNENDIITGINNIAIYDKDDMGLALIDIFVGDQVTLNIIRNNKKMDIKYKVEERKSDVIN